jgi:glycosyltransferase involved in cell wall biosynthesis
VVAHRPLRFCFVTTFYPPYSFGGDAIFVYRLAQALATRGHSVDVVHSVDAYHLQRRGEPSAVFAQHPNVTVHPLKTAVPMVSTLVTHQLGAPGVYAAQMESLVGRGSHDVIHFHNASLMGAPAAFALGSGVKLYTAHEYWLICPTHTLFKFGREACVHRQCVRCQLQADRPVQFWRHTTRLREYARHIDRFLMPSKFARDRHIQDGLEGNFTILPHFVPTPAPPTPGDGDRQTDPYFLIIGRLEKLKGVQDVLSVFQGYTGARLVIAGTGSYEAELKAQARGNPAVEFRGFVHPGEMGSLYRNAIALIAPSLCYETFFLVGAEAMMHGTPVIARRIGSLDEMIGESGAGMTFASPAELHDAMTRLQQDVALHAALVRVAHETAHTKWTLDAHLGKYLGIIDELVANRSSRRAP